GVQGLQEPSGWARGGQMTPPGGFTATRKIGDAAVTIISEGSMSWAPKFVAPEAEWRRAVPEVGADGAITIGLNLAHIRIGNASIDRKSTRLNSSHLVISYAGFGV